MRMEQKILEPGLDALIYSHDLRAGTVLRPAWTLVTRGLANHGQQEIALTILRSQGNDENFPAGVLGYVSAVKDLAAQGRNLAPGDISGYRAPGPFHLGEFVGVAFFKAEAIPGIAFPEDALAGIF